MIDVSDLISIGESTVEICTITENGEDRIISRRIGPLDKYMLGDCELDINWEELKEYGVGGYRKMAISASIEKAVKG